MTDKQMWQTPTLYAYWMAGTKVKVENVWEGEIIGVHPTLFPEKPYLVLVYGDGERFCSEAELTVSIPANSKV